MKNLEVSYQGHVWHVPAEYIAKHRAKYYGDNDPDTTFEEEFEYTMGDNYEIKDWFLNNMNWSDVASVAVLVKSEAVIEPDVFSEDCEISVIGEHELA